MFTIPASLEAPDAQPSYRNALGISSRDKHYASKTQAAIRRADFERYKQHIRPIEDRLTWMYDNPELRANGVQSARDAVARSFRQGGQALRERLAGQGLALSPQQQAAMARREDLAQGLADANAANRANRAFDQRNARIMTGGAPRYGLGGGQ
ncbi:hypothetical protein C3942_07390 [Solimonas fluminis]|uniref:Uncharacterized protein n=1 Tax=Solimonas fluminis TaxID=2086571 RepID=A0A2S5TI06_9GAMM|nr:hypothetical protein [Solimonas fluminis]PPE74577.1 hypothetical protein C3942_07390 [Solimonas fluminis]